MSRRKVYPWDKWFARERLRLKRGKDFECAPYAMAQMIRNNARAREIRVTVSVLEDYVTAEKL